VKFQQIIDYENIILVRVFFFFFELRVCLKLDCVTDLFYCDSACD